MSTTDAGPPNVGRLATGVASAMLLLGLSLWGPEVADGSGAGSAPTTGDVAAVGRPPGVPLPPAHTPVGPAEPRRVDVPSLRIAAPVVRRGLDGTGAIDPPPYATPRTVGWFGGGTPPGAPGASLLVGHVDTTTGPAVFYGLSTVRTGEKVRVTRGDGSVAEFTIDDVQVFERERFDARKAYGPRRRGRAELRLITCGGTFDRKAGAYTANVVVSAYLTGVSGPGAGESRKAKGDGGSHKVEARGADGTHRAKGVDRTPKAKEPGGSRTARGAVAVRKAVRAQGADPATGPGRRPAPPGAAGRAGPRPRGARAAGEARAGTGGPVVVVSRPSRGPVADPATLER